MAFEEGSKRQDSLIMVPPGIGNKMLDAAKRLGTADRWGLTNKKPAGIFLEPYSYATILVKESLCIIDSIAAVTDVGLLLPNGTEVPPQSKRPIQR